jgi:hypothetical protein
MGEFEWTTHPEAEALVRHSLERAVGRSEALSAFAARLEDETSTILTDWVDHIADTFDLAELRSAGYAPTGLPGDLWRHPGAQLPALVPAAPTTVAVRVDDAAAFAQAQRAAGRVEGSTLSELRLVEIWADRGVRLIGVERRSWSAGISATRLAAADVAAAAEARDMWLRRDRHLPAGDGMAAAVAVAVEMVEMVGSDLATSYAMEGERAYWQRRNRAAEVQHARQDRLGMGWGNQDHHTFRSSRRAFAQLMAFFATLGFTARERFYAGDDAGWGAQVQEQSGAGIVVFADVDLDPEERDLDFAATPLGASDKLSTVGLWCELHGESLLSAGMHHLEGQFDFDRLRDDLGNVGIGFMTPFSDMPHLRQCFTQAEMWPVDPATVAALVAAGHVDPARAEAFARGGAPGSHLENLARRGGFKGFNQHNVSKTMRATDPRRYRAPEPVS